LSRRQGGAASRVVDLRWSVASSRHRAYWVLRQADMLRRSSTLGLLDGGTQCHPTASTRERGR